MVKGRAGYGGFWWCGVASDVEGDPQQVKRLSASFGTGVAATMRVESSTPRQWLRQNDEACARLCYNSSRAHTMQDTKPGRIFISTFHLRAPRAPAGRENIYRT